MGSTEAKIGSTYVKYTNMKHNILLCNQGSSWPHRVNLPARAKIKLVLFIGNYKIAKFLCHEFSTQKGVSALGTIE